MMKKYKKNNLIQLLIVILTIFSFFEVWPVSPFKKKPGVVLTGEITKEEQVLEELCKSLLDEVNRCVLLQLDIARIKELLKNDELTAEQRVVVVKPLLNKLIKKLSNQLKEKKLLNKIEEKEISNSEKKISEFLEEEKKSNKEDDLLSLLNRVNKFIGIELTSCLDNICEACREKEDFLLKSVEEVVKVINRTKVLDTNKLKSDFYCIFENSYRGVHGENIFNLHDSRCTFLFKVLNTIESLSIEGDAYSPCYAELIFSIKKTSKMSWRDLFSALEEKIPAILRKNCEGIFNNILSNLSKGKHYNDIICLTAFIRPYIYKKEEYRSKKILNNKLEELRTKSSIELKKEEKEQKPLIKYKEENKYSQKYLRSYRSPLYLMTIASVFSIINNYKIIRDFFGSTAKGKDLIEYLFGAKSKRNKLIQYVNSFVGKDNLVLKFFNDHEKAINYAALGFLGVGLLYAIKIKKDNNEIKKNNLVVKEA